MISGIIIFILASKKSADFLEAFFHARAPLGKIFWFSWKTGVFLYGPNCEKVAQKRPQAFLSHKL